MPPHEKGFYQRSRVPFIGSVDDCWVEEFFVLVSSRPRRRILPCGHRLDNNFPQSKSHFPFHFCREERTARRILWAKGDIQPLACRFLWSFDAPLRNSPGQNRFPHNFRTLSHDDSKNRRTPYLENDPLRGFRISCRKLPALRFLSGRFPPFRTFEMVSAETKDQE